MRHLGWMTVGLLACGPSAEVLEGPPACGAVAFGFDPSAPADAAEVLWAFPDDAWTVDDPASPTGLRVVAPEAPWQEPLAPVVGDITRKIGGLGGFGRLGQALLQFTGDVGALPADLGVAPGPTDALQLWDLDAGVQVPFEWTAADDGRQLRVQPLRPLQPAHLHGVVLTTAHLASDGRCVQPTAGLHAALQGRGVPPRMADRYARLLDVAGLDAGEVSAATVFTTDDARGPMRAAAADARTRTWSWRERPRCEAREAWRECEGIFRGIDFRQDGGLLQALPWEGWDVPVRVLLPLDPGPVPLMLYGHGLAGSRREVNSVGEELLPLRVALVATDAMRHGDHPTRDPERDPATAFLGIDLTAGEVDAVGMRSSFDQTAVDRMQLLSLLLQDPDIDGDGLPDLDPERVAYTGISLGGLLGPAVLAHGPAIDAAVLPVGGGHLIRFTTDVRFGPLSTGELLQALIGDESEYGLFLAFGQTAIDGSDPAIWATEVLHDRPFGDAPPHLLLPVATQDAIVPPPTGRSLARALGLPHVAPVVEPVSLLGPVVTAPVRAVGEDRVLGFFQYGEVTDGGQVVPADHVTTVFSDEHLLQFRTWWSTWLDEGAPVLIDPYGG